MFLKVLEQLMKDKNLNLHQLSKQSDIPYMTLKNFWNKGYENIKLSTLRQLSDFFNVTLDYLVFGRQQILNNVSHEYQKLNHTGQQKADEYIMDLLANPKYTNELFTDETIKFEAARKKTSDPEFKKTDFDL